MLEILQQPNPLSYSLNLRDTVIETDAEKVEVSLYHNDSLIIDEEYNANPQGEITLRFAELVHTLLRVKVPSFTKAVFLQEQAMADFKVEISDPSESKTVSFTAVKGFRAIHPGDIPSFFKNNWLTSMPQEYDVVFHQPLFLTAYAEYPVMIKADFTLNDGTDRQLDLFQLEPHKIQTINLNPGMLIQVLGEEYKSVSLYGQHGSDRYFFKQTFHFRHSHNFSESFFLYENRLGGIDSLRGTGEEVSKHTFESKLGMHRHHNVDYEQNRSAEIQKNIGFVQSKEHQNQIIEFLYSPTKYVFYQGTVHKINVTSSEFNPTAGKLNEFSFSYTYADRRNIYPELEITPNHLNI